MKTVKVKVAQGFGESHDNILDAYVIDSLYAHFEDERRAGGNILIIPPRSKWECACLIFAKHTRRYKKFKYIQDVNMPYINLEKDDVEYIVEQLPKMTKRIKEKTC